MSRFVISTALLAATGCGPAIGVDEDASDCDPWAGACTVTMTPEVSTQVRLELATATTEEVEAGSDPNEGELAVTLGRFLTFGGFNGTGEVCMLDGSFDDVAEIDADADVCACDSLAGCWGPVVYFGLIDTEAAAYLGRGLLMRTGSGELYRGLVQHDDPRSETAELTIRYEGVQ